MTIVQYLLVMMHVRNWCVWIVYFVLWKHRERTEMEDTAVRQPYPVWWRDLTSHIPHSLAVPLWCSVLKATVHVIASPFVLCPFVRERGKYSIYVSCVCFLSVCLSFCRSVCLSVCLSVFTYLAYPLSLYLPMTGWCYWWSKNNQNQNWQSFIASIVSTWSPPHTQQPATSRSGTLNALRYTLAIVEQAPYCWPVLFVCSPLSLLTPPYYWSFLLCSGHFCSALAISALHADRTPPLPLSFLSLFLPLLTYTLSDFDYVRHADMRRRDTHLIEHAPFSLIPPSHAFSTSSQYLLSNFIHWSIDPSHSLILFMCLLVT